MDQDYSPFREASNHIVRCEFPEAESILEPYALKNNVTALTLLAEAAWIRAMVSEDKADQKEATKRLARAEAKAHQGCDAERTGIFSSFLRLAIRKGGSGDGDSEWSGERARELSNATNLAYIYLMQALSLFRGSAKGYISGVFKLKSAWRMYKQLWEREILKLPPGILASLSLGTSKSRGSIVHADDSGPLDASAADDDEDDLAEQEGKVTGSTVLIRDDRGNQSIVGLEDMPDVAPSEEGEVSGPMAAASHNGLNGDENGVSGEEEVPQQILADIYYGIGGFHFFVGLIPSGFRWIVESLGFRGDRIAGRQELQSSMEGGGYRSAEALLLVFWMDTFYYKDRANAEVLLLKARKMFEVDGKSPSPLFQYMGGYLARLQGHLEKAIERFGKAKGCAQQMPVLEQMCEYEIGWCHYLRCDFQKAVHFFTPFLSTFEASSYRAYCSYQLGCALDIIGKHKEAANYMGKVAKLVRKHYSFDQFAARKAAQYLKQGSLSPFDKAVVLLTNHLEAKHYVTALVMLPQLRKCISNPTLRSWTHSLSQEKYSAAAGGWEFPPLPAGVPAGEALTLCVEEVCVSEEKCAMYLYLVGKVLRGIGRKVEAKMCFQRVVDAESLIKEETFIVPYSYCEIGELLVFDGRTSEAKVNLRMALKHQNYDFDKPLGRRIKLAIDTLPDAKKR